MRKAHFMDKHPIRSSVSMRKAHFMDEHLTRSPHRHAGMALRYLWKGSLCRGPTGIEDRDRLRLVWRCFGTREYLRTTCSRGCRAEPGRKLDHNPVNGTDFLPFATRPCPRSASVEGPRAKVLIDAPFATPGWL